MLKDQESTGREELKSVKTVVCDTSGFSYIHPNCRCLFFVEKISALIVAVSNLIRR